MIGFIVFGLVVGALARLVLPGRQHLGILATLLIGLAGSIVGGVIANALGTGDIFELNILGSVVAIASAALLIVVIDRASATRT
ncbi:MAG: GlsB/YeaQ/YmgE family stress response membrane protein [Acidimicrobiia bacterium]|nr:GlsB/YeaQ/YmgE family stress response membrane protein [Acidimicrobiia bacterium]